MIPERLQSNVVKDRSLALVAVTPEQMEEKMTFVNANEMAKSLAAEGRIKLRVVGAPKTREWNW